MAKKALIMGNMSDYLLILSKQGFDIHMHCLLFLNKIVYPKGEAVYILC